MRLCILFWFYKEPQICRNRLRVLRRYNPDIPIYGLFGGTAEEVERFSDVLSPYLDDLYRFSGPDDVEWKWRNGDLMIAEWYRRRGRDLEWDTCVVVQWDMLVMGNVNDVFVELQGGEILLSGVRPIKEVTQWWSWLVEEPEQYISFLNHVGFEFELPSSPLCCQFVVACLPRQFLERYGSISEPELGFLEYRLPIYAQVFGIPFAPSERFYGWWPEDPATKHATPEQRVLTAAQQQVRAKSIRAHLQRSDGARVFHPFYKTYPIDTLSRLRFVVENIGDTSNYEWIRRKRRRLVSRFKRYLKLKP